MIESTITSDLEKFANQIQEKSMQSKNEGKLILISDQYRKWKLDDFEYADSGVKNTGAKGEYFTKNSWGIAAHQIYEFFVDSKIYLEINTKLQDTFSEYQKSFLDNFIDSLAQNFLEEKITTKEQIREFVQKFQKELEYGRTIKGIVELDGVILRPKSITLDRGIELRQTQRSDLEREEMVPHYGGRPMQHHFDVNAILSIELEVLHDSAVFDSGIQQKVHKIIRILRLFKVGSVKFFVIRHFSDSITGMQGAGSIGFGENSGSLERYLVSEQEEKILRNFYQAMEKKIPESFVRPMPDNSFRDIAYKRYEDALMTNGTIERRIANAIMGLEAIFLIEKEQELSYRLRLRVARLMGFFGFDPFQVKKIIRDAYGIRSTFVHGGLLTHEKAEELKEKHGTVKNLLLKVLDYLRISIVFSIFMTIGKPKLLDTIDNSFLDEEHQKQLKGYVSETKRILGYQSI